MKRYATYMLLFPLLILCGCSEEQQTASAKTPPPLAVETVTVTRQKVPIWMQYTAMTKASSEQEVRARVSGRLEEIYFKDGVFVKKGAPLFRIEQGQYLAALEAARARKERDIASRKLAKADVDRYAPLVEEGLAPRATLEQHQARYAELSAQILADDAEIDSARLNLDYTVVISPIDGRVSARRVDVGNLVGYGESTLLTTIMKIDPIYAYFNPPETDVQLISEVASKQKLDAYVEVQGTGKELSKTVRYDGFVDFADNTVDPLTSTITMRSVISNPQKRLMPGAFVYVNIFVTDQIPLMTVPPQAVFEDQLGKFVYIDANGTATRRDVETGYAGRFYTVVKNGLEDGDAVVISGLMKLRPGVRLAGKDVTEAKGMNAIIRKNQLLPEQE